MLRANEAVRCGKIPEHYSRLFYRDAWLRLNVSSRVSRFVGVETPTYGNFSWGETPVPTINSNKKQILQNLATPGFSLEREGPGKAYVSTPKQLTHAKPERIVPDANVSTGVFLFWFVFSFCLRTKRKNEQEDFSTSVSQSKQSKKYSVF